MELKDILIVHPLDNSTRALGKIKNYIAGLYPERTHIFNIHPNDASHNKCLEQINKHPNNGLIIFLGHGRSDKLYGGKGDLYEYKSLVSPDAIEEFPEKYYYNDQFINPSNYGVFTNKKIFCLACNSNQLGKRLIESGAESFIGFGDLPTSQAEFAEKGIAASDHLIASMKGEINYIVEHSLSHALSTNYDFEGLRNILQFITSQRIVSVLSTKVRYRIALAFQLYSIKQEIVVLGDKKQLLLR